MGDEKQQEASEGGIGQSVSTAGLEREQFEIWARKMWGGDAYRHTSNCCGEWEAWRGAKKECAELCLRMAAHAKENAASLKQYLGAEEEARCRELASSYLEEAAFLMDMRSNVQVTGRPPAEGGEGDNSGEHDGR